MSWQHGRSTAAGRVAGVGAGAVRTRHRTAPIASYSAARVSRAAVTRLASAASTSA